MIKYCWEWCIYVFMLVYWAITSTTISLVGSSLYRVIPHKYGMMWGRFILQKNFQGFIFIAKFVGMITLDSNALKVLANTNKAMIVAPNHVAIWDVVFIVAQVPNLICIMKEGILKNPLLGGGAARIAGYLPVNSISQMLRLANYRLKENEQLLMFPEGTRTKTEARWMNPLKGGVALLARKTGAPVVPIFIRSNSRFFEKGWPFYRKPAFPVKIQMTVGTPLTVAAGETVQAFAARLEQTFINELSRPHPLRRTQKKNHE